VTREEIRFDDRAILVTGGGRGIGRAEALLLASRGAKVVVADNGAAMDGEDPDKGPAETAVAEIKANGGVAVACTADIATEAGAKEAVDTALSAFGRMDGFVHNASTSPNLTPADKLSSYDFDLVMRVNPFAGLWLARAAWPHMAKQRYGRILFMTSAGIYGSLGNAHYAAAKSAYIGMMRCLAIEGANQGILVNAAAPSARTRMTERFQASAYADWFYETMPPEKVAVGAVYLLSEVCEVSGEIFSLGGGRIARITLAENEGVIASSASVEQVRDAVPRVMADTAFFHPRDLGERSVRVAGLFGFKGGLESSASYAVKPIEKS
jgi:NAD(P)-dependent dehydrogenase (short-subunit alcohol dehydrogenase family)